MPCKKTHRCRDGFTTVELLVVMAIIVLLISLAIPFVGKLQNRARETTTQAFLRDLSSACDRYYNDFKAYPGPVNNTEVYAANYGTLPAFLGTFQDGFDMLAPPGYVTVDNSANGNGEQRITMAENLVLGLLGGLRIEISSSNSVRLVYDPLRVGKGAMSLNPASPKAFGTYIDYDESKLSWSRVNDLRTGEFFDDVTHGVGADDSIIPEFVDTFGDPMPILYLRAKRGTRSTVGPPAYTITNNPVITDDPTGDRVGQYDLSQFIAYTQRPADADPSIGVGKKPPKYIRDGTPMSPQPSPPIHGLQDVNFARVGAPQTAGGYTYPYNAFWYFRDPTLSGAVDPLATAGQQVARAKDKFILISAGIDRIYGTNDDITSFGSVTP